MVLLSTVPRNGTEMVPSFLCFLARLGAGQWRRRRSDCWITQVTAGLCRHSHECAGGASWTSSITEFVRKGPAVSILGWTEPWLASWRAGESPAFPGGPCGAVPPVLLGFSGVSSSPQHSHRVREAPRPRRGHWPWASDQAVWPPQAGRAGPGLNIHGHKPQLWSPPHPLTHPFPISRSPEKVLCATSPVRPSAAELFSHPSFKEQTSSPLKWLKLLTKVSWGCWQKPRQSLSALPVPEFCKQLYYRPWDTEKGETILM